MPVISEAYFAHFDPAAMAILCEANLLDFKPRRMFGVDCGVVWATIRGNERGEIRCPALGGVTSQKVEEDFAELICTLSSDFTFEKIEFTHGMNMSSVLPPRCRPNERRLDHRKQVTPAILLSEIIAKWDFKYVANYPLTKAGMDMPSLCEALLKSDGLIASESLSVKGTICTIKLPLYERACEKAAFVGSWLVRDIHVAAAADEMGLLDQLRLDGESVRSRWEKETEFAQEHVSGGRCVFLHSFPGPRPWTPSACPLLGVALASEDIPQENP